MVRADEIAALLPLDPERHGGGDGAGGTIRGSGLLTGAALKRDIVRRALAEGFDVVRVTDADAIPEAGERLARWLAAGYHGDMAWMAETQARRASPRSMWPEAKSAIVLGLNYGPADDPLASLALADRGTISVYARGRDYHDLVKGRLKQVASLIAARGGELKVFVDTAPLLEKPLAAAAGLGWQGKHTVLVSRELGNWLFLGVILTSLHLPPDEPAKDRCGTCRRCLDACPTDAFPAPYVLDARRCISYLTIEHAGPIPADLRPAMGNRIYGCDDCLAVCPWNKFAQAAREAKLAARTELAAPHLADLAALDDSGFRALFAGSPVKRTGRDRFVRNVLIACGNSGLASLLPAVAARLDDPVPLVRGAAVWAFARLADRAALVREAGRRRNDADAGVRREWRVALGGPDPEPGGDDDA